MKKLISAMLIVMLALPVTLTAYASNYGIVITRNPYSGTWAEGESAWFEACAQYYSTMEWIFVDPCGTEYTAQEFCRLFPDVTVEGENTTWLTIDNLNSELNDWAVFCSFHSDIDNSSTKWAFISVTETVPAYGVSQYGVNPYAGYDNIYRM